MRHDSFSMFLNVDQSFLRTTSRIARVLIMTMCLAVPSTSKSNAQENHRPKRGPSITWNNPTPKKPTNLAPGASHQTFHSDRVNQEIGYCIYLPPQYQEEPDRRFPVIHNLHGNGGNEWTGADAIALLHQSITNGDVPPMIMVCFNGGHSTFYKNSADGRFPIESIFIEDFIPMIDNQYRTIPDRTARCIEGFSMGGRGATRLAMKHPHLFCSLNCQAGNVPHLLEIYDSTNPSEREGLLLGKDRELWEADDVYTITPKNRHLINEYVRIQVLCGTKDSGHIHTIRDFHQLLLDLDLDHTYIELAGLAHNRKAVMKQMAAEWFDHHVRALSSASR